MFLFKAKILLTGLCMLCFQFPECGYILCKDRKKMIVTQ